MLTNIKINNYLLIESLDLNLKSGLTVVTGETGSGKSIIIDALMLIFGARCNSDIIFKDKTQATFSASFELTNQNAKKYLLENDLLDPDDNDLLICRRVVDISGKSKSYINGIAVTITQIRELGGFLLDIHTQHSSITLLNQEVQRSLLDEYIGLNDKVVRLNLIYKNIQSLRNKLEKAELQAQDISSKIQNLTEKIHDVTEINIKQNEWVELGDEYKKLSNADLILAELNSAFGIIDQEDGSLIGRINQVYGRLSKITTYMPKIGETLELLDTIILELREVSYNINTFANSVEQDPDRLLEVNQRMEQIFSLGRKHRVNPEDLYATCEIWQDELSVLNKDLDCELLKEQMQNELNKYNELAEIISSKRKLGAVKLSKAVTVLLQKLALTGEFVINVQSIDHIGPYGLENIEYIVSFNKGVMAQPLNKVISGGELSRTALSLYLLLSENNSPEVIIFDEIDVGISGRVASVVGDMLHKLSQSRQVICITHQPQSASYGDNHLVVSKTHTKTITQTQVSYVIDDLRVKEIARMLGGLQITEATISHAKEMLSFSIPE